ncbi:hypothetical protein [Aquimarina agarivorans]|uniref:hypothetical protein n=1 Tax=Aquimarina agarivorans TaxID=980584 RepID=UPI00031946E3|nr:hypothetical protein [Aquimarina agarivorans]
MAEIQITTTQNVTINFKAADAGERILAYFIDLVIKSSYVGVVIYLLSSYASRQGSNFFDSFASDMWSIIALVIIFFRLLFFTP